MEAPGDGLLPHASHITVVGPNSASFDNFARVARQMKTKF